MGEVIIIGAGAMGTAFSIPAMDAGNQVSIVGTEFDNEIIEKLSSDRIHPALGVELEKGINFFKADKINELISEKTDVVVIGVSSRGLDWITDKLSGLIGNEVVLLMLTKGFKTENGKITVLNEFLSNAVQTVNGQPVQVAAIGGPCLAGGLALKKDHNIVIAHEDETMCDYLKSLFSTHYYHIEKSTDVIGVEACAAMKNVFALGVASINGREDDQDSELTEAMKKNQTAVVFSQAMKEMAIFIQWMGGSKETVYGLAGLGDLYTTAQGGRNGKLGMLLGQGLTYKEAIENELKGVTVEGADAVMLIGPIIRNLIEKKSLDGNKLPLLQSIIDSICDDVPLELNWNDFV